MPRRYSRILAAVLSGIAGCSGRGKTQRPAIPVVVAQARRQAVPYTVSASGVVMPMQTAVVAPQVDGIVTRVAFQEGRTVSRGQVLFEIQSQPYAAAYQQALAALARDQATAENARREAQRYQDLVKQDFVTREQADAENAQWRAAAATVVADSAQVANAKFNLDNTTVRAPIGGRTGSLLVREGNLVHAAGGTPLVVINEVTPILVRFAVPGSVLPLIQKYGGGTSLPVLATRPDSQSAALPDTTGGVDPLAPPGRLADAPAGIPPAGGALGTLSFIDNAVDTTTGTVMLKASFANRDGSLWPGEFVSVVLRLFVEDSALVVPAQAVLTGQQGTYVYVVDSTGAARQRPVTVERSAGEVSVIRSGLRDGERVVSDGQSRLTPGALVTTRTGADSAAAAAPGAAKTPGGKGHKRAP